MSGAGGRLLTTPLYQVPNDNEGLLEEEIEIRRHQDETNLVMAPESSNPKRSNVCAANPCQNNGLCWNDWAHPNGYKCVCHPEYSGNYYPHKVGLWPNEHLSMLDSTGAHCESKTSFIQESGAMLDLRGFTYLTLPKIENGGKHVRIEVWIKPRSPQGLILYNGQEFGKGDFVTLVMEKGHVQFLFDLGSGLANLT